MKLRIVEEMQPAGAKRRFRFGAVERGCKEKHYYGISAILARPVRLAHGDSLQPGRRLIVSGWLENGMIAADIGSDHLVALPASTIRPDPFTEYSSLLRSVLSDLRVDTTWSPTEDPRNRPPLFDIKGLSNASASWWNPLSFEGVRLYLFGSVSRGTNCPDSDVDILLVGRDRKEIQAVWRRLRPLSLERSGPLDVHVLREPFAGTLETAVGMGSRLEGRTENGSFHQLDAEMREICPREAVWLGRQASEGRLGAAPLVNSDSICDMTPAIPLTESRYDEGNEKILVIRSPLSGRSRLFSIMRRNEIRHTLDPYGVRATFTHRIPMKRNGSRGGESFPALEAGEEVHIFGWYDDGRFAIDMGMDVPVALDPQWVRLDYWHEHYLLLALVKCGKFPGIRPRRNSGGNNHAVSRKMKLDEWNPVGREMDEILSAAEV